MDGKGEERFRAADEPFRALAESAIEAIVSADGSGTITFVNDAACRLFGYGAGELVGGALTTLMPERYHEPHRRGLERFLATGEARLIGTVVEVPGLRRDGQEVPLELSLACWRSAKGTFFTAIARDLTERKRAQAEVSRLAAAVEQAAESIVITDLDGSILYVNPAFERVSGYRREEVLGQNPRILKSGRHGAAFYAAMWRALAAGEVWAGEVVNRRRDGTLFRTDAVIAPVRDDAGRIVNYVSVERDVTRERETEAALERELRERAEVAAWLGRLRPQATPEATAAQICAAATRLAGVDFVSIVEFAPAGLAVPLAVAAPPAASLREGRPLPAPQAAYLRERATSGPWVEEWSAAPGAPPFVRSMAAAGLRRSAQAPIRAEGELVGVLLIGTSSAELAARLGERFSTVVEFATFAGVLLGPALARRHHEAGRRQALEAIIAEEAFDPVFQPIVELETRRVVGYEALTRFRDGMAPEHRFAEASALGVGMALEEACLRRAFQVGRRLPRRRWLSANVSPEILLASEQAQRLALESQRLVVFEITEHVQVADYAALRDAVGRLGPDVHLAVDDAGAGFASFRHILELHPDFVKLDIELVRAIDRDPARRALIAGMRHFATGTGCELIAEGVETEAEVATLRSLGVWLAQGYLFGRPAPVDAWRARAARRRRDGDGPASAGPRAA